jgi:hypothetical protein
VSLAGRRITTSGGRVWVQAEVHGHCHVQRKADPDGPEVLPRSVADAQRERAARVAEGARQREEIVLPR